MGRFRSIAASVAIVAMVSGVWLAVAHDLSDDTACFPDGSDSLHAAGALRVTTNAGHPTSHRCEICHWLRSLQSPAAQAVGLVTIIASIGPLTAAAVVSEAHGATVRLPARAPPFAA
jgi:hypothetical protein